MIKTERFLTVVQNFVKEKKLKTNMEIAVAVDGEMYPVKSICYMLTNDNEGYWRLNLDSGFSYVDTEKSYDQVPDAFLKWRATAYKYLLGRDVITIGILIKVLNDGYGHSIDYMEGYILNNSIDWFDDGEIYIDGNYLVFGEKRSHGDIQITTPGFDGVDLRSYSVDCARIYVAQQLLHNVILDESEIDITLKLESRFTDPMKRMLKEYWETDHPVSDHIDITFHEDPNTHKINLRITDDN